MLRVPPRSYPPPGQMPGLTGSILKRRASLHGPTQLYRQHPGLRPTSPLNHFKSLRRSHPPLWRDTALQPRSPHAGLLCWPAAPYRLGCPTGFCIAPGQVPRARGLSGRHTHILGNSEQISDLRTPIDLGLSEKDLLPSLDTETGNKNSG